MKPGTKRAALIAAGWKQIATNSAELWKSQGHFGLYSLQSAYDQMIRDTPEKRNGQSETGSRP